MRRNVLAAFLVVAVQWGALSGMFPTVARFFHPEGFGGPVLLGMAAFSSGPIVSIGWRVVSHAHGPRCFLGGLTALAGSYLSILALPVGLRPNPRWNHAAFAIGGFLGALLGVMLANRKWGHE